MTQEEQSPSSGISQLLLIVGFLRLFVQGNDTKPINFFSLSTLSLPPVNVNIHGTSNPPCTRSCKHLLDPVMVQEIVPPFDKNRKQATEISLGMCPTI